MQNSKKSVENDISQLGNVDQIREILFGAQSRDVKRQFEKLENSIKTMQEETRKKLEQQQNDTNAKLNNEVETLSRKIKNMLTQQQEEFSDVKDNALKQEKRMQNALDIVNDELSTKHDRLQQDLEESKNTLRFEIELLKEELFEVLEDRVTQLGEIKLSRDDAADIMMEAAMQIKGTKINQQLAMPQDLTK